LHSDAIGPACLRSPLDITRAVKKVVLIGFLLVAAFVFWVYAHLEAYCFFYPGIDTRYAPGYSDILSRLSARLRPG
jgi:hypothetical protein